MTYLSYLNKRLKSEVLESVLLKEYYETKQIEC